MVSNTSHCLEPVTTTKYSLTAKLGVYDPAVTIRGGFRNVIWEPFRAPNARESRPRGVGCEEDVPFPREWSLGEALSPENIRIFAWNGVFRLTMEFKFFC